MKLRVPYKGADNPKNPIGRREMRLLLAGVHRKVVPPSRRHALVKALPKAPKRGITKPLSTGKLRGEQLAALARFRSQRRSRA